MSAKPEQLEEEELKGEERLDEVCACCGKAGVDDIKLKDCDGGCDLVKYCSDACQENHKEHHDEECMKRLAEIRDRDLFAMPDGTHEGDCPICCLPQQIGAGKAAFMPCCSKFICNGCDVANQKREFEAGLNVRCCLLSRAGTKIEGRRKPQYYEKNQGE